MVKGNPRIELVKGDYYQKNIIIKGIEPEDIDNIYISCKNLNICKTCEYDLTIEKYYFSFSPEETSNFEEGLTNYDITFKFKDDKIKTITYCSSFNVLPKINKVRCLNND